MKLAILAAGCVLLCVHANQIPPKGVVAKVKKAYRAWVKADNCQNIPGMTSLCTDDCVFIPPGGPAIRGRQALITYYQDLLRDEKWPEWKELTFKGILENTPDVVIAEHTARMKTYDGEMWIGSGVWIFRVIKNALKLRAVIWNSDGDEPDGKSRGVPENLVRDTSECTMEDVDWNAPTQEVMAQNPLPSSVASFSSEVKRHQVIFTFIVTFLLV